VSRAIWSRVVQTFAPLVLNFTLHCWENLSLHNKRGDVRNAGTLRALEKASSFGGREELPSRYSSLRS
jgi:hypothetical protein